MSDERLVIAAILLLLCSWLLSDANKSLGVSSLVF